MSKIKLAVNAAVNQYMSRARQMLLGGKRASLDGKRPMVWCEYGFPNVVDFEMLFGLYQRHGVATGAVNKVVDSCWKDDPWVIEGEADDEAKQETAWEKSLKSVLKTRLWEAMRVADRNRLVGRYSALLLHFNDGEEWDKPVKRKVVLSEVTPLWESAIAPADYNKDPKSIDFGMPSMWNCNETSSDGAHRSMRVHPDRVFVMGDWRKNAIAWLEPVYNNFVSLEKVEGGSGESYLKNAARQLAMSFDKEVDLETLASTYGVSVDELQAKFNDATRDLNEGNDVMLITQGATTNTLVANVPDPSKPFDVNLQVIACGLDIPVKILVGMQTGERASTEDWKQFNARNKSRRNRQLRFDIEDFVRHLMRLNVIEAKDQFTVMWTDLTAQSQGEQLDNASKMATINASSMGSAGPIFDINEVRITAGFEPLKESELPDDVDPEEDEVEI